MLVTLPLNAIQYARQKLSRGNRKQIQGIHEKIHQAVSIKSSFFIHPHPITKSCSYIYRTKAPRARTPIRPGTAAATEAPPVLIGTAEVEEAEAEDEAVLEEVAMELDAEPDWLATEELRLATAELTDAEADEMALLALLMALETALPVVVPVRVPSVGDAVLWEMEEEGAPKEIWEVLVATVLVLSITK